MKKLLILILSFIQLSTYCLPQQAIKHGNSFDLNRKIATKSTNQEFLTLIRSQGATIANGFFERISAPKIIFQHTQTIDGAMGTDALKITVTSKKVTVRYTSPGSLIRCYELLGGMIKDGRIAGADIVDWGARKSKALGSIDLASKPRPMDEIERQIRANRSSTLYVVLVNSNKWQLRNTVFTNVNSKYPFQAAYTVAQVNQMTEIARREKVTLIPRMELLAENAEFRAITGHSIFSVEGMRFVRALLEEYAQQVNFKKLSLGKRTSAVDNRYMEFIMQLAERCGLEIEIEQ